MRRHIIVPVLLPTAGAARFSPLPWTCCPLASRARLVPPAGHPFRVLLCFPRLPAVAVGRAVTCQPRPTAIASSAPAQAHEVARFPPSAARPGWRVA
jgi:hypothetical protein